MARLTLSMIVKNEESYLGDCLESVKEITDEIIIVDTGSTDKTIDIARKYNAKVYHFEWLDDFSAARNFALSKSSGKWILYLDADERLSNDSINSLKKIISKEEKTGYQCEVISKNSLKNSAQIMYYTRLFYYTPGIRFTGTIHEQIDNSLLENNYQLHTSDIQIEHIGYDLTDSELRLKAERNLYYLLKEYDLNPSAYAAYQIGNTYQILDDHQKACEYFSKSVGNSLLSKEYQAVCYLHMAAYMLSLHKPDEAGYYAERGIEANPELPQLYFLSSQINFRLGNTETAFDHCIRSINANEVIKKKTHKSKMVISSIDARKPIYQGIYIALAAANSTWLRKFLDILYKVDVSETLLIKKIISNQTISDSEQQLMLGKVNNENIQCFLIMLEGYIHQNITYNIVHFLLEYFPENSRLLIFAGKLHSESQDKQSAKKYFEKALQVEEKDATAGFYLISLLIELNEVSEIPYVFLKTEKEFSHIPEVKDRLTILKQKLQPILKL